ncbi:hypothetical protein K493DRAFT_345751 [Basidiobolus meristosporus CBS 931.73]|uniref:Importin N-terminal domain-containing protein n=1 Tax=Basidiobolus meristosporus CBS 931.73 TaxID=1314790 RepID=A0A1Y1Z234_9FUNG|nr:hypothetical protein K493DRAFT_345751 [Basidiobolus meristosporus CBS 931.73]|eukprot:ORY04236.1 hypothetical protein K493DRAFT_345751 [Basidiobolus meristosporus CBS 931.73]
MDGILDFSRELNIQLLDQVVETFFLGKGEEQRMAQQVLTQFQEHPDAWTRVDGILENSKAAHTKFIALQILDKLVQTRWKVLPREQCDGIKNFIVAITIKLSSDETTLHRERTLLNKLNLSLVQILKQEWPKNWPTFIPDIVASSKTNLALCENNMAILKLLSEEIFDYSAEQMTQVKTRNLKQQMCGEFSEIFQLCSEVLEKAQKPSLIKATLETLLRFLNWIPLGYIFETNIIDNLRGRFLEVPAFRNITLKCLTEIGGLVVVDKYEAKFPLLFEMVMSSVVNMIPPNTDIATVFEEASDEEQELIQNLAIFLTSFFSTHLKIVESRTRTDILLTAHKYLVNISRVDDREIFKICLEYWNKLVAELYEESQHLSNMGAPLLNLGGASNGTQRKDTYAEVLSQLRVVMIERMVRPEEVLIVENDEGEIVREYIKETDTITLYKSMRECLVYLTHLDVNDTESIMTTKLAKQMDGSEWSWNNLNKLCWAVGSISGAMNEETEKKFLVIVIKDLLSLCEMKRGKDNKAVVASNIMYIVGQYPRFLKAHWKFLKTVVNKLFEFMHETHEGVQDMACDTFIKISQKCRRHFVTQQSGEVVPFIEEILNTIDQITSDLTPLQVQTFYEAVGYMIQAQAQRNLQERLIAKYMELPNNAWDNTMAQAHSNAEILSNPETIKLLVNILKTNVAACVSVGSGYYSQLGRIYMDVLSLYRAVSEIISESLKMEGNIAASTPKIRGMRTIKKEILKLVETYINKAEDLNAVAQNIVPPFFEAVLGDYGRNIDKAKEPEVLSVISSIVSKLGSLLTDKIPAVLDAVFECTLNMINKDFSEYPEHRSGFFKLLRAIDIHCFPALLGLPAPQFKLIMDSVVWAFKHTMRDIADIGLSICLELLNNVASSDPSIANGFYQGYFLSLLQDIFYVLTDTDHKSGFKLQCLVLSRMFLLVENGSVSAPLFNPAQVSNPSMTNSMFLMEYVCNLLQTAFPHLTTAQIQGFVKGMFDYDQDLHKFKLHVRDFLIQLKEFAGDNADLFLDEREAEAEAKKKADMEAAMRIPGMVKPSDLPAMDEEI